MISIFNTKKREFKKNLKRAANAFKVLSMNPFTISLVSIENARRELDNIRSWWDENVEEYKKELSIKENDFELMRVCLQLPDIGKYRNIEGKKLTYYPNGQIEYEWNYVNGGKHGIQKGWHENGTLSFEFNYVNDHMDGQQKSWYENGKLQSENKYKFTTPNRNCLSASIGWQREYYENGILKEEKFYNEKTFESEKLIRYRVNGSIEELREFGVNEIRCKEYDEKGVIINERRIVK